MYMAFADRTRKPQHCSLCKEQIHGISGQIQCGGLSDVFPLTLFQEITDQSENRENCDEWVLGDGAVSDQMKRKTKISIGDD
jgi:hypothetical protein